MPGGKSHKKSQKGRMREFSSIEEMRRDMRNNSDSDDADAPNDDNAGISGANVANAEDLGTDSDTDDEQETKVVKRKGVGDLIEVRNPNRQQRLTGNEINLTFNPESSSDKREKPKGKRGSIATERERADLARLAIVRQQREEAARKKHEEAAAKLEVEMAKKGEKKNFKKK